jgi:hypothetical protein
VRRQERHRKCVHLGARDEVFGERRRERHALEDLEQPGELAVAAAQCAEVHSRQRARGACLVDVAAHRVLGDVVRAGLGDDENAARHGSLGLEDAVHKDDVSSVVHRALHHCLASER